VLALQIDWADAQRVMSNLKAAEDQMPFAMALALNDATEKTRKHLIGVTWPGHVHQRNTSFIAASLTTKDARASKTSLSTEIYDRLGRGHLMLQAKGGVRTPRGRAHMTVPSSAIPKSSRGVPRNLRPKQLGTKLFPLEGGRKDLLFTRDRRSGRLKLMYVLKAATKIPKRVPFFEDYHAVMSAELMRSLPIAIERAMSTRRVR
jgi:hypothetical protein